MLQIRLRKPSSENSGGGGGAVVKPSSIDSVTVACPDHLVLADLPVAKGIGSATAATVVKPVGRKSRRQLGERVHFCVRCDFPIAIYGRLSPCEHAFCLDCARSDSMCYLCDERIQKIQTIKMMEGIFICAAPHCLKSFLKRSDFEAHIHEYHSDLLLQPIGERDDGMETEVQSAKQPTPSDSNAWATSRHVISPGSNPQLHEYEDRARPQQSRELPLQRPMMQQRPPFYMSPENNRPPGFDQPIHQNHFQPGMQGVQRQESGQFGDRQQGTLSDTSIQQPNFAMPMNSNPMMTPQYGLPPFQPDGAQPFYGAQYDMSQMVRLDSAPEIGAEQGSMLGYPQGPMGGMNFMANYPQPWSAGPGPGGQGTADGMQGMSDSQGNVAFYQGGPPMIPQPQHLTNKGMEALQGGGNTMDPRDGKGIQTQQPFQHLPPQPPHASQGRHSNYYSGDIGNNGQNFGWQQDSRDSFGTGQE